MEYRIRQMKASEYPMLDEFLYEAIFQREGESPVLCDIIQKPELQLYVKNSLEKKKMIFVYVQRRMERLLELFGLEISKDMGV